MVKPTIRLAEPSDAPAVAAIYAPFCESTAVSFEYLAPSIIEMAERIKTVTSRLPWLVLEDKGTIAGYAYASPHRERAAYAWSADTTVYIHQNFRRCGAGRALYAALFQVLRLQGYFNACAGITLPNPASAGLHEECGFKPIGIYHKVGFKFNAWHDVAWYELSLTTERANPLTPKAISEIAGSNAWSEVNAQALTFYHH